MLGLCRKEEFRMMFYRRLTALIVALILISCSFVLAAPSNCTVQNVRFSQTPEKLRLVFDVDKVPEYSAVLEQEPLRLIIEMGASTAKTVMPQISFNDPFADTLQLIETEPGKIRIVVNLKQMMQYKTFILKNPNRFVIDLEKRFDQKTEAEIMPGIKQTNWLRSQSFGPVNAYILTVDPRKGYFIKPVLSNGVIAGVETLTAMQSQAQALAAVNASYFSPSGEIIGLLKIDGQFVSTPTIPRTALGVMPDGKIIFDLVAYHGTATFHGQSIAINGVNRERGANEVILYNKFYGPRTGTNTYGKEYVLRSDGTVIAFSNGNSPLEGDNMVLSVHGDAVNAVNDLKEGDFVSIEQTLGPLWDKAVSVLGAGPTLVKDGSVYLTTKTEDFGSDVAGGRAPRTAIGVTKNGNILLVVVDGRQPSSAGLSLLELAIFMQELGAVDAMNLDGGGSSEMVVGEKIVNRPSDGRERKLGNALVVGASKLDN